MKQSLLLLIIPLLISQPSWAREWTDRASGTTIQAEFISSDGKTVTVLHKGRRTPIELSRLSQADQNFVAEKMAENQKKDIGPYRELIKGEFTHAKEPLAKNGLPFWLFGEKKFISKKEKLPLVIVLHGRRNSAKPNEQFKPQSIATPWVQKENQRKNPCFVVQPYYPPKGGWEKIPEMLDATVEDLMAHLPIDPDRVYLMGFSNGGQGSYEAMARHPDRYAGAIIVAGPVGINKVVGKIKTPIRVWVGEKDLDLNKRDRTVALAKALKESGVDIECVVVKGAGHSCHNVPLKDVAVHKWLFSQSKP